MPGFDGTGPNGIGPTGGLRGFCGGYRGYGYPERPLRRRMRRMIFTDYPERRIEGAYPESTREESLQNLTCRAEMLSQELESIQAAIEQLKNTKQDTES